MADKEKKVTQTENKLMGELRVASSYTRSLIEASLDPLVTIGRDGKITDVNKATEEATGISRERLIGSDFSNYFTEPEKAREGYKKVFSEGLVKDYPLTVRHASGRRIDVLYNASVYRDEAGEVQGVFAAARDITERKRAEEALKASEIRYRRLFEATRDGILILNAETGLIIDVNPFLIEMLGFSHKEFLGKKIWELGFLKDSIANKDIFEELQRKEYIRYEELPLENADGRRVDVEFVSNVYKVDQQKVIQCNIRDIAERKRLEQERSKFTEELQEKNAELERFTYTVSHDLKSPLVTIKVFLGYLKNDISGSDAGRIEQDMLYISGAADKMEKLLDELLDISRIGRIVNPAVTITFHELVQETLNLVAGRIEERGVKVQVSAEPIALYGDRPRLVEIWQNLVENAVKFMGDQPAPHIDIGAERRDGEAVFFVRDNGIGIDPQHHSKLFNLFEKINPKSEGTGMGLVITKRIVELYQGTIWLESKGLGQGTCFRFTLPGALKNTGEGEKT